MCTSMNLSNRLAEDFDVVRDELPGPLVPPSSGVLARRLAVFRFAGRQSRGRLSLLLLMSLEEGFGKAFS